MLPLHLWAQSIWPTDGTYWLIIAFVGEREEERGGWVDNLRPVLSEVPLVHFWVALLLLQWWVGCNQFDPPHTSVHLNAPMCQLPGVGGWERGL